MKTKILKTRRGFTLVELLVVIVIIAALAGLTAPMVIRQRKKADHTQAINNAKQIGLAMLEFEQSYARFPDDTSGAEVKGNTGSALTFANANSNDYFRQLIAAEISQSEDMFYAKMAYTSKPDNVFSTPANALAKGEVGFSYLMSGATGLSTAGNPARPYVVAPAVLNDTAGLFEVEPFDSKGVALRLDGSVQAPTIRKTDKKMVLSVSGAVTNTLEMTGADTVWGTPFVLTFKAPLPK